jgi:NAD(P)-dependent dehydrogenase (short-subunit alcohol dehydrogenase family)
MLLSTEPNRPVPVPMWHGRPMAPDVGLQGKVAVVTGASRGIGKQVALLLARRGARVVLAARTVEPRAGTPGTLGDTAALVARVGPEPVVVSADLGSQDGIDELVRVTLETAGGPDLLVNNAGYTVGRAIYLHPPELPREQWDKVVALNVTAPLMLMQGFWPSMCGRGGGRIINVSSDAARPEELRTLDDKGTGMPPIGPAYGATKAALNRVTNSVANDGYEHNIAVIALELGVTMTETMELTQRQTGTVNPDLTPTSASAAAIEYLCVCDDPMRYTGKALRWAEVMSMLEPT